MLPHTLWVLTVLIAVAVACSPGLVYDECIADAACRNALWLPTRAQFDRFVYHLSLNCSSASPALDLAARVRTTYQCPPPLYGTLDDAGTLMCGCPLGQVCDVPSNQNFVLALLFGLVLVGIGAFFRTQRKAIS